MDQYFFITYQAQRIYNGEIFYWNEVIDTSPMQFIVDKINDEKIKDRPEYREFVALNTLKISREEYLQFKDEDWE